MTASSSAYLLSPVHPSYAYREHPLCRHDIISARSLYLAETTSSPLEMFERRKLEITTLAHVQSRAHVPPEFPAFLAPVGRCCITKLIALSHKFTHTFIKYLRDFLDEITIYLSIINNGNSIRVSPKFFGFFKFESSSV
jgi:hypothetical protein